MEVDHALLPGRNACSADPSVTIQLSEALLAWLLVLRQARDDDTAVILWCIKAIASQATVYNELKFSYDSDLSSSFTSQLIRLNDLLPLPDKGTQLDLAIDELLVVTSAAGSAIDVERPWVELSLTFEGSRLAVVPRRSSPAALHFTVDRHAAAWLHIMQEVQINPLCTISQLLLPNQWDLDHIWSWNSPLPPTLSECLHDRIREQSAVQTTRIAIDAWDGTLTYNDLQFFSDHYATELLTTGLSEGDVVPLCFEKSRWTIVAVLAAMKAGATFVLMDPTLPLARLQNMAVQVGASVMLSSEQQSELARTILPAGKRITVTNAAPEAIQAPTAFPDVNPTTIMYLIFTSGSTGTPKGVKISHQTYTSSAIPRALEVGYTEKSRVLDFASYAFDVSIDSMLLTALSGGCLCIPSDQDRMNDINEVVRRMKINYAGLTPSVARILEPDVIESLEGLGLGGEAVAAADVAVWGKSARIIIGYGPCECTIGCTINGDAAQGRDHISIGKGNGAAIWIVDPEDHNKLMPVGAAGELLVEGPIVGQGYLNDPEKTASAFIQDPKWLQSGSSKHVGRSGTLYKTGDLGRYDPDGSGGIVFVGRKDTQVKLRGQRVELGEIETHLRALLPKSLEVVVDVVKPKVTGGQAMLLAFVAHKTAASSAVAEAKVIEMGPELVSITQRAQEELSKVLPSYMLPTAYIPLTLVPKLISSKVDRKQLARIGADLNLRTSAQDHSKGQLSGPETVFAQMWAEVLNISDAAVEDSSNFFLLGGDSVSAMRLVPLLRQAGIELSVADIFAAPILSDMVLRAEQTGPTDARSAILPFSLLAGDMATIRQDVAAACAVRTEQVQDIFACTPTQESLFTFSLKAEIPYVAQRVAKIPSQISTEHWMAAWAATVRQHPVLRTRAVQHDQARFLQVVIDEGITWEHDNDLAAYIARDAVLTMNLGEPLSRYGIIGAQAKGERHMVWTIHHMIYDGWSEPLILETVESALRQTAMNPYTPIQHFVEHLSTVGKDSMESFWRSELSGAVSAQFPLLPYRDFVPSQDTIIEHTIQMPESRIAATPANLLRGAWAFVASHHIRTNDIVFGETLSGRDIALRGVESIIGPLIATVPVRIKIDPNETVKTFLDRVQHDTQSRSTFQHMGMQNIRNVSEDAQYACETGTGMVIQPEFTGDLSDLGFEQIDVTRESLHFNPYALMLACGLYKNSIRVCAGFDSRLVSPDQMRRMLQQFGQACKNFAANPDVQLKSISILPAEELDLIWRHNKAPPLSLDLAFGRLSAPETVSSGCTYPRASVPWICSAYDGSKLLPSGCEGEVWLESNFLPGNSVRNPAWLLKGSSLYTGRHGMVAATGDIGRISVDGSLIYIGRKTEILASRAHALNTAQLEHQLQLALPVGTEFYIINAAQGFEQPSHSPSGVLTVFVHMDDSAFNGVTNTVVERAIELPSSAASQQSISLRADIPATVCKALQVVDRHCQDHLPAALTPSRYLVGQLKNTTNIAAVEDLVRLLPEDTILQFQQGLKQKWQQDADKAGLSEGEEVLREHWSNILKRPEGDVNLDDGFFRLGGDSVLAMKLSSNLRKQGYDLCVADIFRTIKLKTMAKMVKRIAAPAKILTYEPFSLVSSERGALLRQQLQKLPQISETDIEDFFPVTSAQGIDVAATLSKSRTSYQYTTLFFDVVLDLDRLRSAWNRLLNKHSILRTIFVKHDQDLFQVVLTRLDMPIKHIEGGSPIEEAVQALCADDITSDFHAGQCFTRAFYLTGIDARSAIVLGLSHAQYDGISLPRMLADFSELHGGRDVSAGDSLGQYIAASREAETHTSALRYWRELLRGSSLSVLNQDSHAAAGPGLLRSAAVTLQSYHGNFTTATLLTAAWSLVLARSLATKDVTFGSITSGRGSSVSNAAYIAGPCYQFTPVRIVFDKHWTAQTLLEQVQTQALESAQHDHLGLNTIVDECPAWHAQSRMFDSIVHHQEADDDDAFTFDKLSCRLEAIKPHGDAATPLKVVSFVQLGQLHLGIVGRSGQEAFILRMLELLVEAFGELLQQHHEKQLLPDAIFKLRGTLDA